MEDLRAAEADGVRRDAQQAVLKDRIRELEAERARADFVADAAKGEHLKNLVCRYAEHSGSMENHRRMMPALAAALSLSPADVRAVNAKREQQDALSRPWLF